LNSAMNTVADSVQRKLRARVAERQESWRVPGLFGAVVRDGELAWSAGVGAADVAKPEVPPDEDTQYRIGSITKTFTAVLVLALRDEGKLSLDDRLTRFVAEPARSPSHLCRNPGCGCRHCGGAELALADRHGPGWGLLCLQRHGRGALPDRAAPRHLPGVQALDQDARALHLLDTYVSFATDGSQTARLPGPCRDRAPERILRRVERTRGGVVAHTWR
jgi:hypothetical protein